jgi:hypothetical protein
LVTVNVFNLIQVDIDLRKFIENQIENNILISSSQKTHAPWIFKKHLSVSQIFVRSDGKNHEIVKIVLD